MKSSLKKAYGKLQAVDSISFSVNEGEVFSLLGPNGAGKTTLIGIVTGLVDKTGGTVEVFGVDIDKEPERTRGMIGLCGQEINFDPWMKPLDVVVNQAGYYGIPRSAAIPRAKKILEDLGLGDKMDQIGFRLSGGMKRRLMIARALIHEPKFLILDEPTAGVDVELRRQLWRYVLSLNQLGVTVVLTTHYLEEAQDLCDTIAIVNRGAVVVCEPTATLLRRLDTRTVVVTPAAPLAAPPDLAPFEARLRADGDLAVSFHTGKAGVEQVIAAVRAAGVPIKDLKTEEPDLEDVFVSLTYAAPDTSIPA